MKNIALSSLLASALLFNFVACGSSSTKKVYVDNNQNLKETSDKGSSKGDTDNQNIDTINIHDITTDAIELGNFDAIKLSGDDSDKFRIEGGDIYANDNITNGSYIITIEAKNPKTNQSASKKVKIIVNDSSLAGNSSDDKKEDDQNTNTKDQNSSSSSQLSIADFSPIVEDINGVPNRVTQAKAKTECESLGKRLPTYDELKSTLTADNIATIANFDSDGDSKIAPNSFTSVIWASDQNTGLWFDYNSTTKIVTPTLYDSGENKTFYYTCVPNK